MTMQSTAAGFPRDDGSLKLDNGAYVRPKMTIDQLRDCGITLARILPLNAGWAMYSTSDCKLAGHSAYLSFMVRDGIAHSMSLGFSEGRDNDPHVQLESYKAFLHEEFGSPSSLENNGQIASYKFSWVASLPHTILATERARFIFPGLKPDTGATGPLVDPYKDSSRTDIYRRCQNDCFSTEGHIREKRSSF